MRKYNIKKVDKTEILPYEIYIAVPDEEEVEDEMMIVSSITYLMDHITDIIHHYEELDAMTDLPYTDRMYSDRQGYYDRLKASNQAISQIIDIANKGIYSYEWNIYRNVEETLGEETIQADYLFMLQKVL